MTEDSPLIKTDVQTASSGQSITENPNAPSVVSGVAEIPDSYGENKLILLPVNAHTQHFYWEIGDETLERLIANHEAKLIVRLYIITGGKRMEVESVYSGAPKGNYYAYHTLDMQEMEAVMFVQNDSGETQLLISNRITTPSSSLHTSPWEIWMTKNGKSQKLESRPSDLESANDALTNPSSLDLVVRAEKLRARMGDMALDNPSSSAPSSAQFSSDSAGRSK
ncbi:MAG: DUF4912 domain-containing protein [Helicobacteraceae bacterium]|jgi:hypothetical protein|nr:DUF4912 domain-containing protein [Helicobacteraceae bacterium]